MAGKKLAQVYCARICSWAASPTSTSCLCHVINLCSQVFHCSLAVPCIMLNANQRRKMAEAWEQGYMYLLVIRQTYLCLAYNLTGRDCRCHLGWHRGFRRKWVGEGVRRGERGEMWKGGEGREGMERKERRGEREEELAKKLQGNCFVNKNMYIIKNISWFCSSSTV